MAQTRGFSRALATVRRTVAARRDAKRRARAVRIPPCNPCIVCRKNKKQHPARCCFWRRRWDSNPRDIAVKLISSQSRYDRFDTSAYPDASARKASISIPEMPRGVNVSAGQIRQNDAAKSAKSKKRRHNSRAMDASAGRWAGYSLPSSSRSRTSKRLLQRRVYSCSISGVGCAISGIITVTAPAA